VIRAFRSQDADALSRITLAAIHQLGPRGYTPVQVAAWAARHPSAERFSQRAASGHLIWVACDASDAPVAYALLEPCGHLDMLYCHPAHAGSGLAARLLVVAEAEARTLGLKRLFTEASELARPVFARAGYTLLRRRDFTIGPVEAPVAIHNYAMEKRLA
jgi:putative acetyltransferase